MHHALHQALEFIEVFGQQAARGNEPGPFDVEVGCTHVLGSVP